MFALTAVLVVNRSTAFSNAQNRCVNKQKMTGNNISPSFEGLNLIPFGARILAP